MSHSTIPLMQPRARITEEMIRKLVHTFYARVLTDPEIGPIFADALAGRWDTHLATMVDFWSSVALSTGRYGGKPHLAHRDLGLTTSHFARWLALFEQTARDLCPEDAAAFFVDRARRIGDSLQIGLDIGPKALRLPADRV